MIRSFAKCSSRSLAFVAALAVVTSSPAVRGVEVAPLPLPGPFPVACSNVVQDFNRVAAGESASEATWRPVRRRASIAMFATAQEQEILQALINQKLLVSNREGDDATVEVAHEALFTSWGRLKNWIEAGKQVIFARNRLADDARRWQRRRQEHDRGADEESQRDHVSLDQRHGAGGIFQYPCGLLGAFHGKGLRGEFRLTSPRKCGARERT